MEHKLISKTDLAHDGDAGLVEHVLDRETGSEEVAHTQSTGLIGAFGAVDPDGRPHPLEKEGTTGQEDSQCNDDPNHRDAEFEEHGDQDGEGCNSPIPGEFG